MIITKREGIIGGVCTVVLLLVFCGVYVAYASYGWPVIEGRTYGELTGVSSRASIGISGASPTVVQGYNGSAYITGGVSLAETNCIVIHDSSSSHIMGLPFISGTSTIYYKFIEGAAGGGITVYNASPDEPFWGKGISGTSFLCIPPLNPFESFTVYGVCLSGTCKYWFVEATSGVSEGS